MNPKRRLTPFQYLFNGLLVLFLLATLGFTLGIQESSAKKEIQEVLTAQTAAWNQNDLPGFMATYWNSPDLTFSAGGKTTRGWQATLDRYQRRYPQGKMGQLKFENLEVNVLGTDAAFVLGEWHLEQDGEKFQGNFSLVLRSFKGKWLIVHDHSSSLEEE